jgi:hypothetical protein
MSGSNDDVSHESGGDNDLSKEADEKRLLFDMKGSKKPEYWSFIKLIASNNTKVNGKAVNVLGHIVQNANYV